MKDVERGRKGEKDEDECSVERLEEMIIFAFRRERRDEMCFEFTYRE